MTIKKRWGYDSSKEGQERLLPGRRRFLKIAATGALGVEIGPGALAFAGGSTHAKPAKPKSQAKTIDVDFSKIIGTLKPLNGVNCGPLVTKGDFDLSTHFSEAAIKHVRLHDVALMYDNVVDINYVFPHTRADADDPQSYDFSLTDYYIQSIRSLGAEITYRLGYSWEGKYYHGRHNAPPQDYAKWAAICAHIVQHYNHGWANGHHFNIKYWEVWNEPNVPNSWSGTPEEYYRLYEVTTKALKKVDPEIKVGGPAMGDLATATMEFVDGFLKYCADHEVPLDFASWHIYAKEPHVVMEKAAIVREALDKYGFSKTESVMDEWNYFLGDWTGVENDGAYRKWLFETQLGGAPGAAYVASVLIGLQDSSVNLADYYQGTTGYWGGLFDEFAFPRKPYYTFNAFKFLLSTPDRVFTSGSDDQGFAVTAGLSKDNSEATVLISNFGTQHSHYDITFHGLPWTETFAYQKYVVDDRHNLDLAMSENLRTSTLTVTEEVETPSVCLIRLRGAGKRVG